MKHVLFLILFLFAKNVAGASPLQDTVFIDSTTIEDDILVDRSFSFNNSNANKYLWRCKLGDDPSFAAWDHNDSNWDKHVPYFSYEDLMSDKVGKGVAWFRIRLKADKKYIGKALTLSFEGSGAMQVFLDGKIIHKVGSFEADRKKADYYSLNSQPAFFFLQDTATHVLAIRFENNEAKANEENFWGIQPSINSTNNAYKSAKGSMLIASSFLVGLGTIFASLFLVHFLMFLFYRRDKSNLYFGLCSLCVATILYYTQYIYVSVRPFSNIAAFVILPSAYIFGTTFLSAFIADLFSKRKIIVRIILLLGLITLIVALIDSQMDTNITSIMVAVLMALSLGYTVVMIIIAMIRKMPGAFILGSGIIFFFAVWLGLFVWAILGMGIKINNWFGGLLMLSIVSIPLSISAFLAWRFATTAKSLAKELKNVETLSFEKQNILENQNAHLENEVAIRTSQIAEEKKRSDDLLLNILPQEVAEELKLHGHSKAHRYDEVSVLFTDFVNFTKISEQLGVEELLDELNINFTAFDKIMEKHGLEKIKTIGDAYLAVCGVPVANQQHARNTILAAIDILTFVEERKRQVPYGLDIRIGIHSGSLIAGIIGVKKFAYDIWGDTVNTAARMEQNSEGGKINISESTFQLVNKEFNCAHRGKLSVKGKGEMDMYFVTGKKENS